MLELATTGDSRSSRRVSRRFLMDGGGEIALTPLEASAVLQAGPAAMRGLGLSLLLRAPAGSELEGIPTIKSGNVVGSGRYTSDLHDLELTVGPKIGNANLLQMMDFVGDGILPSNDDVTLSATRSEPVALVIEYVAREVRRFVERPSFRDYVRVEEMSARHPRGRFDTQRLVAWNWPRMEWHTLPCAYFDFTQDVPENRLLAAAVEAVSRLCVLLPPFVRERVRDHVFHSRRRLAGVTVPRQPERLLAGINYHRQNAHFRKIHKLCGMILSRSTVTLNDALPISFCTFALDMASLFERYVWRLFRHAFGNAMIPSRNDLVFPLGGTSHQIRLDGMFIGNVRRVIECKYKVVEDPSTLNFDEGNVLNAHLFQGIAYASHENVHADEVLVVYPALNLGRPVETTLTVSGFRSTAGKSLLVKVLLVSLAHPARTTVEALKQMLPP